MRQLTLFALSLIVGLAATEGYAQIGGVPPSGPSAEGFGGSSGMSPDQARRMADQLLLKFGGRIGLDPEALKYATPEERERMLRGRAGTIAEHSMGRMERMFGMSVEEMRNLSPSEKEALRVRMMARFQPPKAPPAAAARPLPAAPAQGFPDGSVPLPVASDFTADLVYDEAPQRELLLVAADIRAREIVWRETLTTPISESLVLTDLAPDPSVLVLELIDSKTRRVVRRYRPVATPSE